MLKITDFQAKYFAYELSIQHGSDGVDRLSQSLFDASVDLNPHQINAALFALNNPLSQGVVLADEVDERREELIDTLEQKLNRKTEIEDLFTIQWRVQ